MVNLLKDTEMKKYYEFRKTARKLYDNDVQYGDLCGSILHIRDKNKCIDSIQLNISSYEVVVEFESGTDENKKNSILSLIIEEIRKFVRSNIDKLPIENVNEFKAYIYSPMICDVIIIGDIIKISL